MEGNLTLGEIGERSLVKDVLQPRYVVGSPMFGDDCAQIRGLNGSQSHLVATTDPCPVPAAHYLGFEDYYYWGWLLATINLSDLAAAGATPSAMLTSYVLPSSMTLSAFVRLLDGVDECCSMNGTEVIGGNLKEGPEVSLSATAIGVCAEVPLSRRGARVGDAVLVIGDLGLFWAGFFATQRNLSVLAANREYLQSNLLTPQPKVAVGAALARNRLVSAAVDNSDGLFPSLVALCEANGVGIDLDFSGIAFPPVALSVAEALDIDPIRFALGWGDWQLVVTCNPNLTDPIVRCGYAHGTSVHHIGEVVAKPGVSLTHEGRTGALLPLESERFSADSWFVVGLDEYARRMLELPLITWPKGIRTDGNGSGTGRGWGGSRPM